MQKAKGITLVSLIITVIIMLILAGVSISVLFDPKGVIERGKIAAEEANISNYSEALQNIGLVLMPEKVEKKLSGKSYMDRYEEEARKEAEGGSIDGSTVTRQNDETVRVVTEEGYVFDVTEREVKYVGKQGETPAPPAIIETDLEFKTNPEEITNKDVVVTIVPKITIDENYTIQYVQKNLNEEPKETEWKNYALGTEIKFTQKGNVFVRLINNLSETGQSFTHTVNNIDKQEPNTFEATAEPVAGNKSNSIIVKGHTTDKPETTQYACSGIKEYYFKQVGASDNSDTIKQIKDWGDPVLPNGDNDISKTFESLTQNGTYYFVIKAVDNAGNETITEKVQASTDEVPGLDTADITFNVSPTTWTNSATVTINLTKTFAGYTLQYAQKDKGQVPSDSDWTNCSSGQEVTLTKNGNVFARLIDNNKQEGTMIASQDISNIDTTLPEGDSSGITTTVTDTQIEAKLNVTDAGGSGLAKVEWKYSAKNGGMGTLAETNNWSELYTDVSKPGETSKQASTTITGLIGNTEYDIKAIIYDVAGNTNEVTRLAVKTNPTPVTSITVAPTELSLGENENAKLTATVQPPNATDKTVTWRSEDDQTATVEDHKDGTATVIGVKAGTTNIVATAGEQSVKCSVTVENTDLEIELKVEEEKVTGTEIPVTAKVTKAADGTEVKEGITYEFYKNNEPDGTSSQTATHTFKNLDETAEYTLKVVATSEKGKTAETYVTIGALEIYVDDSEVPVCLRYTVGTTWEEFINSKYNKKITEDKELEVLIIENGSSNTAPGFSSSYRTVGVIAIDSLALTAVTYYDHANEFWTVEASSPCGLFVHCDRSPYTFQRRLEVGVKVSDSR